MLDLASVQADYGPGLYVVATPIGHLGDITLRALATLHMCDVIACEDSRITSRLLAHYDIRKPMVPYHDHNGADMRPQLLARARDEKIVLVSDAGTPLISDPGYKLIREAQEQGVRVHHVPGASAVLTALVVSGLPTDQFHFAGFLPEKQQARQNALTAHASVPGTLIYFEAARRLPRCLMDMAALWPDRQAVVARELTKRFEETRRDTLQNLSDHYAKAGPPKGEVVILLSPLQIIVNDADLDAALLQALKTQSPSAAAKQVAADLGLSRNQVYARAQALKTEG